MPNFCQSQAVTLTQDISNYAAPYVIRWCCINTYPSFCFGVRFVEASSGSRGQSVLNVCAGRSIVPREAIQFAHNVDIANTN